jgi:hypothetical protein
MNKAKIHKSITLDRVTDLVERAQSSTENPGLCLACGAEADGCEPDACEYECEGCGEAQVYAAEELLMRGVV